MFERLLDIFKMGKHPDKPVKKNFLQRKDGSVKKPSVVSSDRKGPAQAALPEARSQPLLAQATRPVPVTVNEPAPGVKPSVTLPPDIDPKDVVVVTREPRKADGERFRYMDKPLKPLGGDSGRSEVIKYVDKRGGDVIKYNLTPLQPQQKQDSPAKKTKDDVIKYTPVRIEIKG